MTTGTHRPAFFSLSTPGDCSIVWDEGRAGRGHWSLESLSGLGNVLFLHFTQGSTWGSHVEPSRWAEFCPGLVSNVRLCPPSPKSHSSEGDAEPPFHFFSGACWKPPLLGPPPGFMV